MVVTVTVVIQIISMVLCVVGFLQLLVGAKWWTRQFYSYYILYVGLFLYAVFTLTEQLLSGREGSAVHHALYLFIFLRAFIVYTTLYAIVRHLISRIDPVRPDKRFCRTAFILYAVQVILSLVFHFTNFCYYIDETNHVCFTGGYFVHFILCCISLGYLFFLLVRYGSRVTRDIRVFFIIYGALFFVTAVCQMLFYDIHFFSLVISVGVVVLNLFIINERAVLGYKTELEVERLKTDVMLSQIKPHFLYNSLMTIEFLCDRNPKLAKKAISEFTVFLSGNMDSLKASKPIPFETELCHTKAYLALEKLRFEEDLTVVEQIECTSFSVPPLTLQPIVENAVRHGIRGKADGKGTVTIAAREQSDCYEVVVTDDGCGTGNFDGDSDGERHLGIKNVRYRVEKMCSGSLLIDAVPGRGTTVVITLPKQKK